MPMFRFSGPFSTYFHSAWTSKALPDRLVYTNGRIELPLDATVLPSTTATKDLLKALGLEIPDVFAGDKGEQVPDLVRAICQLALLRVGITATEGLDQTLPHNSPQLPAASVSFTETATTYPQVAAVVDKADVAAVPGLLGELEIRLALQQVFEEMLLQVTRGITATYNRLDTCVRKYMPVLKTMEGYSGIGVALRPYYALTKDPTDKADTTKRIFNQGVAKGEAKGRAEAQAEAKKVAKKAGGTQLNVGVTTPQAEPAGDEPQGGPPPAPRKGKRKSTR